MSVVPVGDPADGVPPAGQTPSGYGWQAPGSLSIGRLRHIDRALEERPRRGARTVRPHKVSGLVCSPRCPAESPGPARRHVGHAQEEDLELSAT
jgi:hypothetical protein